MKTCNSLIVKRLSLVCENVFFFSEKGVKWDLRFQPIANVGEKTMNKPQGKQQPAAPAKAPEQKKPQAPAPQPQKPKAPGK
jgi:hypothetical protein